MTHLDPRHGDQFELSAKGVMNDCTKGSGIVGASLSDYIFINFFVNIATIFVAPI